MASSHLAAGASLVLTEDPLISKSFWQLMKQHQVSHLAGVPFSYQMLRTLRLERMALPALRCLTQAGGRLAKDQARYFARLAKEKGWQFFLMYGQTEATARIAYLPDGEALNHPDCIGQPIPGGTLWLRCPDSGQRITELGHSGELCYQGPNVMLGYASSAADLKTQQCLAELQTGDLAELTPDGWFKITGRRSRLLKIQGKRWQLDHLEQQLHSNLEPGPDDFLCCSGWDDRLLLACNPQLVTAATALLREQFMLHPSLFQVLSLTELPRLSSGKPDYTKLQQLAASTQQEDS